MPTAHLLILALLLPGAGLDGDLDESVRKALEQPIIGPNQALAEVQWFTETRVPVMPVVRSAEAWKRLAEDYRARTLEQVVFRGEAARWRDASKGVEWLEELDGGPGYRIRKLRIEAVPGLWVPALLYEPDDLDGKVPVVLNVNGHDPKGKAADYKQLRCINLAKRGILALNLEWFGMGQFATEGFSHGLINAIDLCGTSGIATHFLAMSRGLDVLLAHEHADPERVGVTGLSGGGWQTSFFSPLDPRVTFMDPVAGYSSFKTRARYFSDLGDSEQTPCDLATVVDYTHLTAMMAPHPILLTFNDKDDCCFAAPHALPPLLEACGPIYRLFGVEDRLRSHINEDPGTHNYLVDNRQALYRMLGDQWFAGQTDYPRDEIPSDGEVKTAEELQVELSSDNKNLHSLSLELSEPLPRDATPPDDPEGASSWTTSKRAALRGIVRPYEDEIRAKQVSQQESEGLRIKSWTLSLGTTWSVPAVEFDQGDSKGTAIVLADEGRAKAQSVVGELLERKLKVVAIDPFYFGEAIPKERDNLWPLMIATVGERPIGIQAGEVLSVARWLRSQAGGSPLKLVANGPRTSTIALVAAALEPETFEAVELHRPLGSLKVVLEEGRTYSKTPELFCFGLLEQFDVATLVRLVGKGRVALLESDERAEKELGELAEVRSKSEGHGR